MALAGTQPDALEELAGPVGAVAPEPAEQLLRAVAEEVATDDEAEDEASEFHGPTLANGCGRNNWTRTPRREYGGADAQDRLRRRE
jgi:hypothetical protein